MGRATTRWGGLYVATVALAAAIALGLASHVTAATFPDHPIKLIVPFGAGGPPDVAARIIGAYLSEHLGPVVVENHVGAGGTLAARLVATSPPDGYTLLARTAGSLSISPQLYKDAGIDPLKQFAAVALVSSAPLVLAIKQSVPAHSVKELVAYAKANPGKLNYGAVIGTPPHLSGEMFKHITGTNIVFVPYKTASQATTDVLSGHMNMTVRGHHRDLALYQIRPIARARRHQRETHPGTPDVPTMDELGYPGMPPDSWQAIVAPAGTPAAIIEKINAAVNEGLATPELRHKLMRLGGEPQPKSVADFAAYIADQYKRWGDVIRITGVTLN